MWKYDFAGSYIEKCIAFYQPNLDNGYVWFVCSSSYPDKEPFIHLIEEGI